MMSRLADIICSYVPNNIGLLLLTQDPPYMTLKSNSTLLAGNDRFEGYLADILRLLATSIGFDYNIRLSRDGKHGDLSVDGEWDGMIGDVQRGVMCISLSDTVASDVLSNYFRIQNVVSLSESKQTLVRVNYCST